MPWGLLDAGGGIYIIYNMEKVGEGEKSEESEPEERKRKLEVHAIEGRSEAQNRIVRKEEGGRERIKQGALELSSEIWL